MDSDTHPVVVVLAVIGALTLVAVAGMFLMMGGMMGGMRMAVC